MHVAPAGLVQSHSASFYVHRIKPQLAATLSTPAYSRLLWLPVHATIIVVAAIAIAGRWLPWPALPALSLVIGLSFSGLMFLGHETMHGAILRGRWAWAKTAIGTLCFAPLVLSPRLWSVWHNRMHHANANQLDVDPDMYPSLARYRSSGAARFGVDHFATGGRRWRGILCLVIGFTVHSVNVLVSARARVEISARDHRRALIDTSLVALLWVAVAIALGATTFVFVFVVPHVIANLVVMSFIVTNHGLSSATESNDPLVGSLSVTAPRWIEWLTLDFGHHVEHHLFPSASGRQLRAVRDILLSVWPDLYQSMPLSTALATLFRTGRVYQDATTLVDPLSGGAWPTLASSRRRNVSDEADVAAEPADADHDRLSRSRHQHETQELASTLVSSQR